MKTRTDTTPINDSTPDVHHLGRYGRIFLLALSLINLGLGIVFYTSPGAVISYWPWPVKELATRFLGAIFLAISLGCWSAIQARLWQRAKILVLVGGSFFWLTGIVSIFRGATVSSNAAIWVWTVYFLTASAGCLIILVNYRWHRKETEVIGRTLAPRLAKVFFGVQTSVVGIFGIMMLLLPSLAQEQFWPWKVLPPTLQTFASEVITTSRASSSMILPKYPSRIIVLLPLDAIFPSLALIAVGISWNIIVAESPSWTVTAVWLVLYSFVAVGSTLLHLTTRRGASVQ